MDWQSALSILNQIAAIAVVLGLCLFSHETGHFLAAKAFKCRVHDFALGFGPSLLKKKRGDTTYRLNLVPFGGYVRIAGMEPGSEQEEGSFHSIPRYQGAIILAAGVFMNMVLAVIVFAAVTMSGGVPDPDDSRIMVGKVMAGSAAERDGLLPDDEIVAVEGCQRSLMITGVLPDSAAAQAGITAGMMISDVDETPVDLPTTLCQRVASGEAEQVEIGVLDFTVANITDQYRFFHMPRSGAQDDCDCEAATAWLESAWGVKLGGLNSTTVVGAITQRPDRPVELTVRRDGEQRQVVVVPDAQWDRQAVRERSGTIRVPHAQVGKIGVVLQGARIPVGLPDALLIGVTASYEAVKFMVDSLYMIVTRKIEGGTGGPVAIMAMSAQQARVGWDAVMRLVGLISANLAVINLVPIPPFDGFRIVVIGWEGIIKRRINAERELAISLAGFITIIILLMILTSKDILNLIRFGTP